jgi:hypothetical protein
MTGQGSPRRAGKHLGLFERYSEGRDGRIAPVGIRGKRSVDHEPQRPGDGRTGQLVTRWHPGQEMVEHASEAEHVAKLVGGAPGEPFGTRVPIIHYTASAPPCLRVPIEIETDELDERPVALGLRDEYGSGRDAAMNDPDLMRRLQAGGDLEADIHRLLPWQRTAGGEHVSQEIARETFPDNVGEPVGGLADLHKTRDVRMTYLARSAELMRES